MKSAESVFKEFQFQSLLEKTKNLGLRSCTVEEVKVNTSNQHRLLLVLVFGWCVVSAQHCPPTPGCVEEMKEEERNFSNVLSET